MPPQTEKVKPNINLDAIASCEVLEFEEVCQMHLEVAKLQNENEAPPCAHKATTLEKGYEVNFSTVVSEPRRRESNSTSARL
jgi:hypothetical protein